MLRGPFVQLFGPVFAFRPTALQPQTYHLTWRFGESNSVAVIGNSRRAGSDAVSESSRDSEEGIIKQDDFATAPDNEAFPVTLKRRASQIMVTNEFSVVSNDYAKKTSMAESEGMEMATASNVHDEKTDGKKPFSHI
ncbi:hypothetical protein FB567DRAFT_634164 [Paraphoma chrysanthemicola]|uniref:Uncharacterized protein n=1 Tax=Paraphoma chrysanthemicola TaxID=798071 RepID=A0A8K0QT68_9PLEO|nr:hypothetical protein FB567DRAFT_634164 [Paraphoma chrysanthemicola]